MSRLVRKIVAVAILLGGTAAPLSPAVAQQQQQPRLALVIGDGAYARSALPTAANDAGLVAQTLTAAGFDVTGARDLGSDDIRRSFRDFLTKAGAAGPNAIVFVYLSGYALQFDGDNYYVPVDATLARETDIPIQSLRLADFTRALAALPLRARVVVLDAAYQNPAIPASEHVAPGLSLVDAEQGSLIAFNAAPGTVAPNPKGTYGVYGQALAEMMRSGGVPVDEVFDRVRLRVNQTTKGAQVPWDVSKLTASFAFLQAGPGAPALASAQQSFAAMSKRPIREFPVEDAYSIAVARDTFDGYNDFVSAFPDSPYAARVRTLLAVRREALIWRRTVSRNSPDAYWTYLRRYPHGPHVYDARRRLASLSAAFDPPSNFNVIDYDVPPPPEVEYRVFDEPRIILSEPDYAPPPPPPVVFLPPRPTYFVDLPPPPPSIAPGFLPIPIPIPIPYSRPYGEPGRLEPPAGYRGQYAQPRPFAQEPNGNLIPQNGDGQGRYDGRPNNDGQDRYDGRPNNDGQGQFNQGQFDNRNQGQNPRNGVGDDGGGQPRGQAPQGQPPQAPHQLPEGTPVPNPVQRPVPGQPPQAPHQLPEGTPLPNPAQRPIQGQPPQAPHQLPEGTPVPNPAQRPVQGQPPQAPRQLPEGTPVPNPAQRPVQGQPPQVPHQLPEGTPVPNPGQRRPQGQLPEGTPVPNPAVQQQRQQQDQQRR
ncbi:caspase family protein, partial [Lichenihabitans psoromatis]|uniref:caspase family protein n=1 Tax=Lichenihabitans psoromatis TaxID=2528642 RepID=UPI0013F1513E